MLNKHKTPHLLEINPNVAKEIFIEGCEKPTMIFLDKKYTLLVLHNEKKVYHFSYRECVPFNDNNGKVGVFVNIFGNEYKVFIPNKEDWLEIINIFTPQIIDDQINALVKKGTNHE
jgi:hypothetical protein